MCCPYLDIQISANKPDYRPYPESSDNSLGAALKRKRLDLGFTQQEVADLLGIRKDSYQKHERNIYLPHITRRNEINEFLGYNYWNDGTSSLKNRLLCYRISHRLTMSKLAELTGISCSTIERIENGFPISTPTHKKILLTLKTLH